MKICSRTFADMGTQPSLIIGTRGSQLALWQAHFLQEELKKFKVESELKIIKTQGDKIQNLSFDKIEGKGFFTKELEDALLNREVHVAVHSMKDLPTTMPEGLVLAGVSKRADPHDWLLIRKEVAQAEKTWSLPENSVVGTSSARRKALLLDLRSDLIVKDLRGNVPTRIDKLRSGNYDAIVLAAAGITRLNLNLDDLVVCPLHANEFVPAPAQGVLAYQCLEEDVATRKILAKLHDAATAECTNIERKLLKMFDGGCHLPLGAFCKPHPMGFSLVAAYAPNVETPMIRKQLNLSTSVGMAEEMHKVLSLNKEV